MHTIKELEDTLKHVIVSLYFSCYEENEIEARKKVINLIIKQIASLGEGIALPNKIELAEHINDQLSIIYEDWGNQS